MTALRWRSAMPCGQSERSRGPLGTPRTDGRHRPRLLQSHRARRVQRDARRPSEGRVWPRHSCLGAVEAWRSCSSHLDNPVVVCDSQRQLTGTSHPDRRLDAQRQRMGSLSQRGSRCDEQRAALPVADPRFGGSVASMRSLPCARERQHPRGCGCRPHGPQFSSKWLVLTDDAPNRDTSTLRLGLDPMHCWPELCRACSCSNPSVPARTCSYCAVR